jgi:orotate phosphoribosyltransferase
MLSCVTILERYKETGAYLEGHFLLASGKHSPKFLQSTTVLQHPTHAEALGCELAGLFRDVNADFVIGPAMGGVVLAYIVARHLGVRAIFAEKSGPDAMQIREAFEITPGERFIVVEDVMTTGGSLSKARAAAEALGASCAGIGCIIDRGLAKMTPLPRSLARLEFDTYSADACPLCQAGIPLVKV